MQAMEENKVEMLFRKLSKACMVSDFVTIEDLAIYYGVHPDTVRNQIWLQPNYGKADFGERPRKWKYQTFQEWIEITPEEHKRQYYQNKKNR